MKLYEAFSASLRLKTREKYDACAICRVVLPPDSAWEDHSASGLHLRRVITSKGPKFLVTSTSKGHQAMKGKTIDLRIWPYNTETDEVLVCIPCHDELRRIAMAEAKLRGHHGVSPYLLTEVTAYAIKRGRPLSYNLVG